MVEQLGTSKPVIHMAHTNTNRNGSSGSLNFVSQSSFTIRCRCGVMSKPLALKSATSFCACDNTTAVPSKVTGTVAEATPFDQPWTIPPAELGCQQIDPTVQLILRVHDETTRADSKLELA
jgi:hypothetical protein